MNRDDLIKGCRMFAIKIAIYWLAKLVICQIDGSRLICSLIAKGFWPCVATFAFMDFLAIPQLRKLIRRWKSKRDQRLNRNQPL